MSARSAFLTLKRDFNERQAYARTQMRACPPCHHVWCTRRFENRHRSSSLVVEVVRSIAHGYNVSEHVGQRRPL